ncbi:MAG TPA: ABC transporter ATP-binding protein [Candidatus Gallacutalibacter stercoravium]|nr:ABC transporter ATP-binding protein [Candidatus Gallacutalibacter stercoravium]
MNSLIELDDIKKIYPTGDTAVYALNGVSLNVGNGEFVAIVGQSGSGKSTLMNILGCLDTPTQGSYYLNGEAVATMDDRRLSEIRNRQIGFIFQGYNLIPGLDAIENVELPLLYRGIPRNQRRQMSKAALERVGLKTRMHHRPAQMSGGQQQRVAIARAIAARPPLILADEPTGNLDSRSGMEILNILRGLHQEGKTVILITHDNDIAASSDRIIRIHDGQIVADTSRETCAAPRGAKNIRAKSESASSFEKNPQDTLAFIGAKLSGVR